jgi:hypothetical protein
VLVVRDGAALADRLRALAPRAEVDAADGVLRVVTADTPVALADVALALGRTCALVIDTAAGTPQPLIDRALALRGDGVVVDAATAQRLGARVRQRGSTWTMRPRRRRLVPVVAAIVLVAAVVAGLIELGQVALAPAGERLAQWTLDADGGPHEVVMLPSNLWDQLHLREASYVLRTDVVPEQRGQPLTLVVPCFHAPLALAVDGVAIVDIGDAITAS